MNRRPTRLGWWSRHAVVWFALAGLAAAGIAAASPFGINVHLAPPNAMDRIEGHGIKWLRIDFVWAFVATGPDEHDWSLYDRIVDRLEADGYRIYATLAGTPAWATDGPELSGVPRDPADWAEFCYLAAARYRGRVDAWGVWNEPNLTRFWTGTRQQFLDDMLEPALAAIAAADPEALRGGPDLAHLSSGHWDDWLTDVIRTAGDGLDVVAHHVYPSDGSAADVASKLAEEPQYPWEDEPVRRILQRTGWWGRPFWLTETGTQSGEFDQGAQALFYSGLVRRLFDPTAGLPWVDRVFFYELADSGQPGLTWGILEPGPEFEPKLAASFYRDAIATASVDDAELLARPGRTVAPPSTPTTLRAVVRNTGTRDWSAENDYRFVPVTTPLGWTVPEVPIPAERTVRPGATVELAAPVTVGPDSGFRETEVVRYRLARANGIPFGDAVPFEVWVTSETPPEIRRQPGTVIAPVGGTARFTVEASGEITRYRWQRNGLDLADSDTVSGSSTPDLLVVDVGPGDAGEYRCLVATPAVEVASRPGRLVVTEDAATRPDGPRRAGSRRGPDPKLVADWLRLRSAPGQIAATPGVRGR